MPTPLKTSDLVNDNEGVWVNDDRQAFINAGANDTTLSPSDKERILTEWAKWKKENPKLYALGNITPFIGSIFSRNDLIENPSLENQVMHTLSLAGDAAIFMPKFLPDKVVKGFKLAKTQKYNPYWIASFSAGKVDDVNDIAEYFNQENNLDSSPIEKQKTRPYGYEPTNANPVTESSYEPKPRFDGIMLPEVTVTADRVRNTIMKWSVR